MTSLSQRHPDPVLDREPHLYIGKCERVSEMDIHVLDGSHVQHTHQVLQVLLATLHPDHCAICELTLVLQPIVHHVLHGAGVEESVHADRQLGLAGTPGQKLGR